MTDATDIAQTVLSPADPLPGKTARTRHAPASASTARAQSLTDIDVALWQTLADHAIEPNGYFLPDWELAVNASSPGRGNAAALTAHHDGSTGVPAAESLIGLWPTVTAWHAYRIPLPALVSADPYGTLGLPLLHEAAPAAAARGLLRQAGDAGYRALILRDVVLDGPVMMAFRSALAERSLEPVVLRSVTRACLDATRDADEVLREALGGKKLKELRRQRNRLADHGGVSFAVARNPDDIGRALDQFLALEASGWKGRRGTAMAQRDGDAAFLRRATRALAARGACEIVSLTAGATVVAAGVVLRHRDRAFWFKIGIDERFARLSPGVQLALELTRHLCADPAIRSADSTAAPDHPMIDPIWRGRLNIGDVLLPLRRNDPMVALLHATLVLRHRARAAARRLARLMRPARA